MINTITFARFDAILAELGFRKQVIPGSHVNYRHPGLKTPLVVRLHKPKEMVPSYVLLGTRVELDNFGIIAAEEFEELLKAAAA